MWMMNWKAWLQVRFEGGKLVMDENQVEEDKELAADERTFRLLKDIGNSIFD